MQFYAQEAVIFVKLERNLIRTFLVNVSILLGYFYSVNVGARCEFNKVTVICL